ncbi:MAG: GNAT family N-acetyltransferase [Candidatus Lokiarchaeota archaeon]|nr:GNAT family N-acetyltransferase [Candidatus Lokiarchaeota archaeon]
MFNDLENLFRFDKTNIHLAGKVAARAYFEADDFSYSPKDSSKQMKFLTKLMNLTFRISLKFGKVYAPTKNIEGVAAWLPHDKINLSTWHYIRHGALSLVIGAGKGGLKKLIQYGNLASKKHKEHADFPHIYLYNLAIDPSHQGKGYASRLLKPMFTRLDEANLHCYLESHERNQSLYEHFGFDVVERISRPEYDYDMLLMLRNNK